MKRIVRVFLTVVLFAAMMTAPAAADEKPSWDEFMEQAAKAALEYGETGQAHIFAYTMFDINRDGIPELVLTPLGGNRGTAHPVLVYMDGEYRYLCEVNLAYNWNCYYFQSGDEISMIIEHDGGPATESIQRVTRLTLQDDGIYMREYRHTELWDSGASTGEWTMYSSHSEFTEWLSVSQEALWDPPGMPAHQPDDEDALFYEWFESGRLPGTAPYASVAVQDFDFDGESASAGEYIQLVIYELGNQFQAQLNNNPNTGK